MDNLPHLTNAKLAKLLQSSWDAQNTAQDAVFALAIHGCETFGSILGRLGQDHATVMAYNDARETVYAVHCEAGARVGASVSPAHFVTVLERSPRYVRVKRAA